ncbi:ABC transporter substrate-binding protein [Paraburkholderia sp. BR10882]|uniref:ABC transporter substrate-binding protein n=1 Tax=unclassified Paraburkholderia TaxID=2615204 RepID=UPI0034CE67E0
MPKRFRWNCLISACAMALYAVGTTAHAKDAIQAGIYPNYPPLDMRDPATNQLAGFDVELAGILASHMGRPLSWTETSYAELISAVKTGRIQIFFNGMFDTPERRDQIAFVDYLRSGSQFLTLPTSPYKTPASLCGKKVGISRLTSDPETFHRWSESVCVKNGLPAAVYMPAENSIDARMQMRQGRTDAVLMDSLTIPFVIKQSGGQFVTVGEPLEFHLMGIGVNKADAALQQELAKAMQRAIDDGSYASLLIKWGLSASSAVPKVTINTNSI